MKTSSGTLTQAVTVPLPMLEFPLVFDIYIGLIATPLTVKVCSLSALNSNVSLSASSELIFIVSPTPIPSSDYDELEFQKTFITRLAKHIGTLFCPHDPHEEYAADSDFPER